MSTKHFSKCLTPLTTNEMKIFTLRFILIGVRLAVIRNTNDPTGVKVTKGEFLYTMGRNENISITLELSSEDPQKKLEKITTLSSYLPPWNNLQRLYILFQSYLTSMFIAILFKVDRKGFTLDVHQMKNG